MTTSVPPPGGQPPSWQTWTPRPTPEPPAPELTELSRRLLAVAALLGVVLIGVVAQSWLSGGEDTQFNPIAQAAEKTQGIQGMKIAVTGNATGEALSTAMLISGEGEFDGGSGLTNLDVRYEVPGRGAYEMEFITGDHRTYMRSDVFEGTLPPGKAWVSEVEPAGAGGGDAESMFEMLGVSNDDFESLGQIKVRGKMTKAYRATVDRDAYADVLRDEGDGAGADEYEQLYDSSASKPEVTVWVDARGCLRRLRTTGPLLTGTGLPITMDLQLEFYDFGTDPEIELPAADEVIEMADPSDLFGQDSAA
jgi:hypothetical protein